MKKIVLLTMCLLTALSSFALAESSIPEDGIVMFDHDGIIITATGMEHDKSGYLAGLDLLIENNSENEKNVVAWPDGAIGGPIIVNGYTVDCTFYETVAAGMKSKTTLKIDSDLSSLLEMYNLYSIFVPFGTYESGNDFMKHNITTYPAVSLELGDHTAVPIGEKAYAANGIEIYKCGFKQSYSSLNAILIIMNNTGSDLCFKLDSMNINGFMAKDYEFVDVFDSTYAMIELSLGSEYAESDIERIGFKLSSGKINDFLSSNSVVIDTIALAY